MDSPADEVATRREVTQRLGSAPDPTGVEGQELFDLLYGELRRMAAAHLRRERASHTLQATALVHEAWVKLVDQESIAHGGREHFLSVASQAMRRILVDHARGRGRARRGGERGREPLVEEALAAPADESVDLVALDEALCALEQRAPRQARLIELRFFGGLTAEQTAEVLGCSLSTAEREWRVARAWLLTRL